MNDISFGSSRVLNLSSVHTSEALALASFFAPVRVPVALVGKSGPVAVPVRFIDEAFISLDVLLFLYFCA